MQRDTDKPSNDNAFGVIVSYHPDLIKLTEAVHSILRAGLEVIIFDNTPTNNSVKEIRKIITNDSQPNPKVTVAGDGINHGLATAYNRCVDIARHNNSTGVFFFDQDSTISERSICLLLEAYKTIRRKEKRIGVFGAQPIRTNGTPYRVKRLRELEHWYPGLYEADFVISSFSFISMDVLSEIGPFREDLFIDLVDTEFSYRCRAHGYTNLTCTNITFVHKVGEADLKLPTGRTSAISTPLRNYYQTRNIILVGRQYKIYSFIFARVLKRFFAITLAGLIQHNLKLRWRYFVTGVFDGLRGRGGIAKRI